MPRIREHEKRPAAGRKKNAEVPKKKHLYIVTYILGDVDLSNGAFCATWTHPERSPNFLRVIPNFLRVMVDPLRSPMGYHGIRLPI